VRKESQIQKTIREIILFMMLLQKQNCMETKTRGGERMGLGEESVCKGSWEIGGASRTSL
jgi:hypothetical protein